MANTRTLRKSYTATKNVDLSGHYLHCSVSWLHAPDWLLWGLIPNWLTLCFGLTNVLHHLFQSTSKMLEIRSPPWPPIHKHTQRPTHTHPYVCIYIYIYIYAHTHTYECSVLCHMIYIVWSYIQLMWPKWYCSSASQKATLVELCQFYFMSKFVLQTFSAFYLFFLLYMKEQG